MIRAPSTVDTNCPSVCSDYLYDFLCFVDCASLYNLLNKANLVQNLFLVYLLLEYLSISTCFGQICAHRQEKQLCLRDTLYLFLWNNQQMQLYAVNFIPMLGSLYMFRVFYTPIIKSTIFNCIYSHWYKP